MNQNLMTAAILCVLNLMPTTYALANWQIGAAKCDITPAEPVLLTGYASRTKPSEGIDTKLWARALSFCAEEPYLVMAVDNCGVPAAMIKRVYERVSRATGHPPR